MLLRQARIGGDQALLEFRAQTAVPPAQPAALQAGPAALFALQRRSVKQPPTPLALSYRFHEQPSIVTAPPAQSRSLVAFGRSRCSTPPGR